MKFFIDTANLKEIAEAHSLGLVDGVTTNPSLCAKEGVNDPVDFRAHVLEICKIVNGPVCAEVVATETNAMVAEARELASIHEQVVVKIPMTPDGLRATRILSGEGVRVNVTLIFQPVQALLAAKAGAAYVSPFIGRLDDINHRGMEIVQQTLTIFENYGFDTEIIVASVRHPLHVLEAALTGADIATIPYGVMLQLLKHPLTDVGLAKFLEDWRKSRK
uniref:Probable transaldolase n=1 Tax=Desulfobacca acetoxidans TaxID=60893 RepID=A0A7C5EQZ2_9BACT